MAVARGRRLAGLGQLLLGVLADRLEQAVARLAAGAVGDDERLLDQRRDEIEDRLGLERVGGGYGLGGIEREAAREDGQPAQQRPLGLGEEVVAPVDQRAQRLLAAQRGARAAGEQAEAVAEAVGDLLGRQHRDAGGRQLDRERYPVEPMADLRDRGRVLGGEREAGLDPAGALDEQAHGRVGEHFGRRLRAVGVRGGQRRHTPGALAGDAEQLAAARQDVHLRAAAHQSIGDPRRCLDQVLAVVEHDEGAPLAEVVDQRIERVAAGHLLAADRYQHRVRHDRGVGDRSQLGEPHAAGERLG